MRIEGYDMTGMFATSKAGHDKGKLYIIIKEEGEYVYLSDGYLKPVDAPKKKKQKHIQLIKKTDEQIRIYIEEKKQLSNEVVKRAIKEYGHKPI
jgi:ribosomal protein L14E/L6E/L27E